MAQKTNLEDKLLYRLIKVLYIALLLLISFFTLTETMFFSNTNTNEFFENVMTLLLVILITYCILNVLKEALYYIFFGKKFSWDWLFIIRKK